MIQEIKVGSVVRLKSGGAKMTVSLFRGKLVECEWLDAEGKLHQHLFAPEMLTLIDEETQINVTFEHIAGEQ